MNGLDFGLYKQALAIRRDFLAEQQQYVAAAAAADTDDDTTKAALNPLPMDVDDDDA